MNTHQSARYAMRGMNFTLSATAPRTMMAVTSANIPWKIRNRTAGRVPQAVSTPIPFMKKYCVPPIIPKKSPLFHDPSNANENPNITQNRNTMAIVKVHCAMIEVMLCLLSMPP